jgi:ribosomal protein S18 acetylase RimI-like enzyme
MTLLIRTADATDAADLARIHVAGWRAAYEGIAPPEFLAGLSEEKRAEDWRRWLEDKDMKVLLAFEDGNPCGFTSFGKLRTPIPGMSPIRPLYSGEVYAIYLLPDYWRRGIGTRLLREAAVELRAMKHKSMCLWVMEKNERGIAFYRKHGGERCGKKDVEIGGVTGRDVAFGWRDTARILPDFDRNP